MSMRLQAGILRPGYDPLRVPNAPTIGAASVASGTSVSVTFTAPSCVGGGAITSYTAYCTTTGTNAATGASSPITVAGLTTGQAYTFRVFATNAYGPSYQSAASNSVTPVAIGQQAYTSAGTYSWVAPAGVASVSVVAVGGGAGGGGSSKNGGAGGGGLGYSNNYAVSPGNSYTVVVGSGGAGGCGAGNGASGGDSYFINTSVVRGGGGTGPTSTSGASGGSYTGTGGGNGGNGGSGPGTNGGGGGGGGAGGYAGAGGAGGIGSGTNSSVTAGSNGAGGGAGGGAGSGIRIPCLGRTNYRGASGGGVGILGQGANGAGGTLGGSCSQRIGNGGSGGSCGTAGAAGTGGCCAGLYGGGGGGGAVGNPCGSPFQIPGANGRVGAVRIIWPGTSRSFPSTNTGNL